jgi:hypothetical protein
MKPAMVATIDQVNNAAWFSRVGVKDTTVAMVLPSWEEAVDSCASIEWEDLCHDAML